MNQPIQLTRIHALNWYGYQDSLTVEGNLLLAGLTGSGKSILMDLIQFVLVGDQRLIRFNQSASGDRSDRTLKGYSLGDLKQDEGGAAQFMRSSAITYVALEFSWGDPRRNGSRERVETWGIRVEFASAAEQHGRVTPFFIPAALQRGEFLDSEKRPLDLIAFKAMAESHLGPNDTRGRVYTDGLESYLRDMAQQGHLNFDRSVLRSLLPTAMSFSFLKSFNEFCRRFILPADRLDVSDVTASYRTFLRYEHDLADLDDQLRRLDEIDRIRTAREDALRDRALSRWLEAELRGRHAAESLREAEENLATLRKRCGEEDERLAQLEKLIAVHKTAIDETKALINETPEGQLYGMLKARNSELTRQCDELRAIGTTIDQALAKRVRNARTWLSDLCGLPCDLNPAVTRAVEKAIDDLKVQGAAKAEETLRTLQENAQRAADDVSRAAAPELRNLSEVRIQLSRLKEEIAALEIGKLPFPTRLLDALNNSLLSRSADLPARHLAQLCEVTDERWRPAVEVAFTRKFAVVVDDEHYEEAERIYHQLKEQAPNESLVNPAKARKLMRPVQPGSLAEKLSVEHPVARAIVSQLFGDVVCVERREELREHERAILPDGFMTRGPFVQRLRHYDNLPFVGRNGLRQQLDWKRKRRADLEAEEKRLLPVERSIQAVQQRWRELFEAPVSLYQDLVRARELPNVENELKENFARLNSIDRAKFDELAHKQSKLESELQAFEQEQRALDRSENRVRVRAAEKDVDELQSMARLTQEKFDRVKNETDISQWLPRLNELRQEMLERMPMLQAAAGEFASMFNRCDKEAEVAWEQLKAARRELSIAHSRFGEDEFPIESKENDPWEKQRRQLAQSEIPDYREKSGRERKNWEHLFRTQVLERLHAALLEVESIRILLNNSLRKPIGNNRYHIRMVRNPDFVIYHRMIEASALARQDELFFASADADLRDALAYFLTTLAEQPDSAETDRLLDYRFYYDYDMIVDEIDDFGNIRSSTSVDRQSGKFSGGENQSPYFIAILASYLRAYKRHDSRRRQPSLGLVPIDEAFSKLSGERIKDCIEALRGLRLQGVFSMSTGNIPYALEHCDSLIVVAKDERRAGKRVEVRNIPVSMARDSDDARRLIGENLSP